MAKNPKIVLFSLFICLSICRLTVGADRLAGLLPDAPKDWIKSEAVQRYNRKNLFDYIDGGAEVYLTYDFRQLVVQKYVPKIQDSVQEKSITLEIWQMNSSEDAYGVFSLDQDGEEIGIGRTGAYIDGLLRFWKGPFFVRILEPEGSRKEIILELGRQIDKKIKGEGELPLMVSAVPSDSLVAGSIRFFHKQIILNNLYSFTDQNILGLDMQTNCALADFQSGDDSLKLLLVRYPDTTKVRGAEERMQALYPRENSRSPDKIFENKERELVGMDLKRDYLILIFEGKNRKNILWLLDRVNRSLDQGGSR
ncbi:MAG: DUF6599 family protein [Candidatus Zixiibacteriota bacterium]